jgi:hypothetical protein
VKYKVHNNVNYNIWKERMRTNYRMRFHCGSEVLSREAG